MSQNVNSVSISLNSVNPTADGTALYAWSAPAATVGGGVTIVGVTACNDATTSGTVGFSVRGLKFSSAGTPALNGTVFSAIGGTVTHWTADVPQSATLGADRFLSAGEHLFLDYDTVNAGTPTAGRLTIHYVMGRASY